MRKLADFPVIRETTKHVVVCLKFSDIDKAKNIVEDRDLSKLNWKTGKILSFGKTYKYTKLPNISIIGLRKEIYQAFKDKFFIINGNELDFSYNKYKYDKENEGKFLFVNDRKELLIGNKSEMFIDIKSKHGNTSGAISGDFSYIKSEEKFTDNLVNFIYKKKTFFID